jgi:hypothetical protein
MVKKAQVRLRLFGDVDGGGSGNEKAFIESNRVGGTYGILRNY